MTKSIHFLQLVFLTALTFCFHAASAQAPQAIPYQAVARDNIGSPIINQAIGLRLSIRNTTASGTIVYQETQTATTNSLGLFTLNIGQGTAVTGTLSGINWSSGSKFVQVEFDPAGGANYTDMGTTQLMSVPYALSSGDNQWIKNGIDISNNNTGNVGIGTTTPTSKLTIDENSTGVANTGISLNNTNNGFANSANITLKNSTPNDRALQFINWNSNATSTSIAYNFLNNATSDLLTIQNGGNIGIGTNSPTAKLHVTGSVKVVDGTQGVGKVLTSDANGFASWQLYSEIDPKVFCATINKVPKWDGTKLTDGIIIDNGTKVGIGTNSPSAKLDVVSTTDTALYSRTNNLNNNQIGILGTYNAGGYGAGVVGIGWGGTIPTSSNDIGVYGSANSSSTAVWSNGKLRVTDGTQGAGKVLTSDVNGLASWAAPAGTISAGTQTGNTPYWNGTTWVTSSSNIFNNGGNVGIGTTTPSTKFDVIGTSTFIGTNSIFSKTDWSPSDKTVLSCELFGITGAPQYRFFSSLNSNYSDIGQDSLGNFVVEQNDNPTIVVNLNGNVGIGTTTPLNKLSVVADSDTWAANFFGQSTSDMVRIGTSFGGVATIGANNNAGSAWTNLAINPGGGNVGIGTSTPTTAKLVIAGAASTQGLDLSSTDQYANLRVIQNSNSSIDKDLYIGYSSGVTSSLHLYSNNAETMTIKSGKAGIGTNNPLAPLHINITANVSPGSTYLYNGNGVGGSYSGSHSTSILASGTIVAGNFAATSDARIKQVIGISNSTVDLELLNKIKITDYTYIDKVANGTGVTKKVIAQEVEQILPNAVNKNINFIPNVYALATKTAMVNGKLQITMTKEHKLNVGDKLKWIDEKEQEQQSLITAVINAKTFEIDYAQLSEKAFVYGIEVNDFRTVDYEAIAMLNVSATQELLKRIESLESENVQLKALNEAYNTKLLKIEDRLNILSTPTTNVTAQK